MINELCRKWHNLVSDKKFSEILTGSAWALTARVVAGGFGLLTNMIVARYYGAAMVGIVAVLNSFLMLATLFTVLGTNTSLLRLIPEHLVKYSPTSAFSVYRKIQFMVVVVSLCAGSFYFFTSGLIAEKIFFKPQFEPYFALASVFIVFKSLEQINSQAVRSLRLIKTFAFLQLLPFALSLIVLFFLGFFLSVKNAPVYAFLAGFACTGIVGLIVTEFSFRKKIKPTDSIKKVPIKKIISISLPMLMSATMSFVIAKTGIISLSIFRNETEVGFYAIVVSLATLTSSIILALNTMVGPRISELFHAGKVDELFYVAKKSSKLIFYTTTPILLGLIIFGKPLLKFIFGQEFVVAYPAMLLLVLGQFVHSISGATGLFMNMTGNQRVFGNIVLVAGVFNIVLNLLLTPTYGVNGAAFAAMCSLIGWNLATLYFIKKTYGKTTGYFPQLTVKQFFK